MNTKTQKYALVGSLLILLPFAGCQKDFLNTKPDKSLLVPTSLDDFQAILDNTSVMNLCPEIGLIASDDYYTTAAGLAGLYTQTEKNSYLWAQNVYEGEVVADWNTPYQQIFYSNVVLDGLNSLTDKTSARSRNIRGSAMFYRGFAYYNLAQVFAAPYDSTSAANLPGLPLRRSSDPGPKSTRGTLQQTYNQVLADITGAVPLLPVSAAYKSRPDKAAAYALLARIYLSMERYSKAAAYADSSLKVNNKLNHYTDYNPLDYRPFPLVLPDNNDEVDFDISPLPYSFDESPSTLVDSNLFHSYKENDLRKSLYFTDQGNGGYNFQGSYSGNYLLFAGLTTAEMYLIRAECKARADQVNEALADLNTLLVTRFQPGTFQPFTPANAAEALTMILTERRKELFSRALRWSDLRRLNKDPRFAVTLKRVIGGQVYTLLPEDKRYVFPIPDEEIRASGIPQNDR